MGNKAEMLTDDEMRIIRYALEDFIQYSSDNLLLNDEYKEWFKLSKSAYKKISRCTELLWKEI